jgi:diacylglycerol O-acyltransferase
MVSNVPGPVRPGALAGRRVEGMYPVPLVADGLGLNVTVHGCGETLHHAVASAPGVVDDPGRLVTLLEEEHDRLAALAG